MRSFRDLVRVQFGAPSIDQSRRPLTRAQFEAERDSVARTRSGQRVFQTGEKPVIRWVKGDGLDDEVTQAALCMATDLFGPTVDYCLCTNGISPERARGILASASQPVEWWPVTSADNPPLARCLFAAGCPEEEFGYWWKWFPERCRAEAPEWILDGDMVITGRPPWFEDWCRGADVTRISQDDSRRHPEMYGQFAGSADLEVSIYSGLASLPPGVSIMPALTSLLEREPLAAPHDGRGSMSEQGAIAVTFQTLGAATFPLSEFPFARAFDPDLDFGLEGDQGKAWGIHFGHAFRRRNQHFEDLLSQGTLTYPSSPSVMEKFAWLGNSGQWGVPGWGLSDTSTQFIVESVQELKAERVLELGTSRGRMSAMLADGGAHVTSVDHVDRGAATNLSGLDVEIVVADAFDYLSTCSSSFPVVVVDLHDNSVGVWKRLLPHLTQVLEPGGHVFINNATLWQLPEWEAERGVRWAMAHLPEELRVVGLSEAVPGVAVLLHG